MKTQKYENIYRPSTLGFEKIFNDIENVFNNFGKHQSPSYPPHNIIKTDENNYIIELAVAGFNKSDIEITVENGNLVIKGSRIEPDSTIEYIYRGIGTRSFIKEIKLAETIVVLGATFNDGILSIGLQNIVPENKKSQKIEIGENLNFQKSQLLKG